MSGGPSIINILELMFPENLTKFVDVFFKLKPSIFLNESSNSLICFSLFSDKTVFLLCHFFYLLRCQFII